MRPKALRINIEDVLKVISMLGFGYLFFVLIRTGDYKYYVHPRIVPYLKFGIIGFVIISTFIVKDIFKPVRKRVRFGRYILFIIPLLSGLIVPPQAPDSNSALLEGMTYSEKSDTSVEDKIYSEGDRGVVFEDYSDKKLVMENEVIVIKEENFLAWTEELYTSPEKYNGKEIEVVGFVFRDEGFEKNEFVPARYYMSCCAADMQPVGILCRDENAHVLENNSWVSVKGTIDIGEYKGSKMAIIMVRSVEKTQKPENEIVYY